MDSSFPRLKSNSGYVQPPPIQSNGSNNNNSNSNQLYPTIAPGNSGTNRPAPTNMNPTAASQQRLSNIGTLNVSELKKQTKPLEMASSFIESYLEKDQKYPDLDRIIMRKWKRVSM